MGIPAFKQGILDITHGTRNFHTKSDHGDEKYVTESSLGASICYWNLAIGNFQKFKSIFKSEIV